MHRITIHFPKADDYYVHRVRNLAEDLYREIELTGMGTVKDIDRAIDVIDIEVRGSRHLGTVNTIIKKELQRHNFQSDATFTRR